VDLETAQAIAVRWRPEFAGAPARLHSDGWNVWALEVGDWVVRIPRRPDIVEELQQEMRLLDAIRPLLPVAVPRSRPVGVLDDGTAFFAHPRIAGDPIDADAARSGLVASALVGMLHAVHAVPPRQVSYAGAPVEEPAATRARVATTAERVHADVLPLLAPADANRARSEWDEIGAAVAAVDFDLTVVHGGLYAANILVDRSRHILSGVIDWTSLRVGDPAVDFAGLVTDLGAPLAAELIDLYADEAGQAAGLLERAVTYARIEPYAEVLFGLSLGAGSHVRAGLARLGAGP